MKIYAPQGYRIALLLSCGLSITALAEIPANNNRILTLQQAVNRTLQNNPQLAAYPFYLRQADANKLQADLRPTPEMSLSADNILGSGNKAGVDEAEITLSFSQTIELGGKRQSRYDYASGQQHQLQLEYDISRLDILAETSRRYYQLLALQAKGKLLAQRIERERQALTVIKQRARAGAVAQADVANMALQLANSEAQLHLNQRDQQQARLNLSQMWLAKADFSLAAGSLLQPPALPNQTELKAKIDNGIKSLKEDNGLPDFRYQLALQRLADNQLQLAQANGRSDITLNAGLRQFEATGDQALTLGVSMPLAFEKPNRGAIARAQVAQELSRQQTDIKRQQLALALEGIQQRLIANMELVERIQTQQMPLVRQLLKSSQIAYTRGQYSVLQWIDAQQQFFALQLRLVDTRLTVFNQILELERVLGRPIVSQTAPSETADTAEFKSASEATSVLEKNKI